MNISCIIKIIKLIVKIEHKGDKKMEEMENAILTIKLSILLVYLTVTMFKFRPVIDTGKYFKWSKLVIFRELFIMCIPFYSLVRIGKKYMKEPTFGQKFTVLCLWNLLFLASRFTGTHMHDIGDYLRIFAPLYLVLVMLNMNATLKSFSILALINLIPCMKALAEYRRMLIYYAVYFVFVPAEYKLFVSLGLLAYTLFVYIRMLYYFYKAAYLFDHYIHRDSFCIINKPPRDYY